MNPDIITKVLVKRKLSIDDFKGNTKDILQEALPRCLDMEIVFIMDTHYDKKHDLCFPPDRIGHINLEYSIDESKENFYAMPYEFTFGFVNFSKRTLGGYCYDKLDRLLNDDLYNELNSEFLKFKEEYKYNVIKSLFFSGRYFRYKDFPLQYSYTDGDIFEHPINADDSVTANFAKVISFDDKGFNYAKGNDPAHQGDILFEDLDFIFKHKIEL
jgi:hypothetical protein